MASKFVSVTKEDIDKLQNYSALELYLYSGIRNITEYSGNGYEGTLSRFINYYRLEAIDWTDVNNALTHLKQNGLINIEQIPDSRYQDKVYRFSIANYQNIIPTLKSEREVSFV